jgi:hypothetical protein
MAVQAHLFLEEWQERGEPFKMEREIHNIKVPYLVRFTWISGRAKEVWEDKVSNARVFIGNTLPKLLVHNKIAEFAPILPLEDEEYGSVADSYITSYYSTRWSTMSSVIDMNKSRSFQSQVYGNIAAINYDLNNRWDIYRDLWQLALAPECCKKAYFECPYKDPYHHLYDNAPGKIKTIHGAHMNCLLAPLGFFISPIVSCSLDCPHAAAMGEKIRKTIQDNDADIYITLKMITEMPLRIDSYRGIALVDTPMFKGLYTTDAYKNKYILDAKVRNPELFTYEHDWVARGANYPYRGIFTLS